MLASPSPAVVPAPYSNAANVDPEEAFVAAISSCHMLTFLYLASRQGFQVDRYQDEAVGVMTKNERSIPWVSVVTLHPTIAYSGDKLPTPADVRQLHHTAHEQCFIANSIKTEVRVAGQTRLFEETSESQHQPPARSYPEFLCPSPGSVPAKLDPLAFAVIHAAIEELRECLRMLQHCVGQLSHDQVWSRPDESQNAIGNLLLHLAGNLRQWIVVGLAQAVDSRNRPAEFAERQQLASTELLARLEVCVQDAIAVLSNTATSAELLRPRRIQGFEVHGIAAIQHSVSHFRGHTQEIIGRTRQLLGKNYRFAWIPKDAVHTL